MLEKHRESERRILELQGRERLAEPRYDQQESQENLLGREVAAQSVLAYGDSLYLQPVENTRWVSRLSSVVSSSVSPSDSPPGWRSWRRREGAGAQ